MKWNVYRYILSFTVFCLQLQAEICSLHTDHFDGNFVYQTNGHNKTNAQKSLTSENIRIVDRDESYAVQVCELTATFGNSEENKDSCVCVCVVYDYAKLAEPQPTICNDC